jgi:cytochrome P450
LRTFDALPGPRGVPVFGNLLQVDSTRLHLQLEQWCEEFGPIFKLRLANRRVVVVGDHELVATALRDRPDGFRRTTRLEQVWTELGLLGGVFGATGDTWRRQRRMVMAGFDPGTVRRYHPALQRVAQRLGNRWQLAAQKGSAIRSARSSCPTPPASTRRAGSARAGPATRPAPPSASRCPSAPARASARGAIWRCWR